MQKPWIADVCSKCSSGGCVHGRGHGSASVEHSLPAFSQTRELSADKCKTCDSDYMSSIKQWYLCASSKDMIWVEDSSEVIASYLPVCVSALAWCAHCLCLQSTRERTSNLCMTYVWWRIRWQELGSVFWALKTVPTYCAVIGILFPDDWYNYRCDDRYWSSNLVMTWHSDKKMFLTVQVGRSSVGGPVLSLSLQRVGGRRLCVKHGSGFPELKISCIGDAFSDQNFFGALTLIEFAELGRNCCEQHESGDGEEAYPSSRWVLSGQFKWLLCQLENLTSRCHAWYKKLSKYQTSHKP